MVFLKKYIFKNFYSNKKSFASKKPANSFDSWSQNIPKTSKSI